MGSKHRNNNSLRENSMKMVVNIIKLSSFSIAEMSLGTPSPPVVTKSLAHVTGSVVVAQEQLLSQIPGSRRSQEPQGSSKPKSFVMQPDEGNGSSHVIHQDNSVIDRWASEYIRKCILKYRFPLLFVVCLPSSSRERDQANSSRPRERDLESNTSLFELCIQKELYVVAVRRVV
ncbi:hypothetical protein POTOM_049377 [Populus tomentosa]|uniref:Uncharacterized protein n=1 Tax=Populus tomentosa TaxID=118781 RepID=A0A8X7YA88_POPTO|nr:hypothetical protein POTOM_049377 [Populus tomentosa]